METTFEFRLIHGGDDPLQGLQDVPAPNIALNKAFDDGCATIETPITQFLAKAEKGLLVKNAGVADELWDAELTKTIVETDPAVLPARSQARLEKAYAVINRIFASHEQEAAEAREIARRLLLETRAEVTAVLAA